MWRRVVLAVVCSAGMARAGTDTSQPPPVDSVPFPTESTPATAPVAQPIPPQPVQVVPPATTRIVDRSGPAFLAGFELVSDSKVGRLDVMVPIPLAGAPHLRAGLELGFFHNAANLPDLSVEAYAFEIIPTATYDWKLPIRSKAGDFVLTAEGGLGVDITRIKFDEPFMPGTYENLTGYVLQVASAFQFRGTSGLLVSVQYFGLQVPLNTPQPTKSMQRLTSENAYAFALMVGYQL